jgi:iron complex transport system ATP-binding protein
MPGVLNIDRVSYAIGGIPVLRSVSFHASAGEFIGLLGVNGAGKSTILDILAGLRKPDAGDVIIAGRTLSSLSASERAHLICHLPQGVRNELPFTAEQIVLMGRYSQADVWMESRDDRRAVDAALSQTLCTDLRRRLFYTLSAGERQRVLVAACLAQSADLLLMDEPATYMDLRHQLLCFDLFRSETGNGRTCIAVTHDLNLAMAYCSRILVLDNGAIEADMNVDEAWRNTGWLFRFSERIRVERSLGGTSWVAYR